MTPYAGRRLALALTMAMSILVGLAGSEAALRLAGFEFHPFPVVQFGWPDPETIESIYQSDPDLLWVTKDYQAKLAAARESPPFVVFMGDSCTEFSRYPRRTLEILAERRGERVRGVSLATGGWTAVQGSWQLSRDVLPLRPTVVTLYYGWNDHWLALGPPDAELPHIRRFGWLADRLRIVQAYEKARFRLAARDETHVRVSIDQYERTLRAMVGRVHRIGAQAVLVTAPSAHEAGREPVYLLERHLRQLSDLIPLHRAYVQATRRAAEQSGAILCDAFAAFDHLPGRHRRYFRRDGIHFNAAGDEQMAQLVSGCIERAAPERR
jgi:lysophospholipase L1-like esterase